MGVVKTTLNPSQRLGNSPGENGAHFSDQLFHYRTLSGSSANELGIG
jgi:hypothetical protein